MVFTEGTLFQELNVATTFSKVATFCDAEHNSWPESDSLVYEIPSINQRWPSLVETWCA